MNKALFIVVILFNLNSSIAAQSKTYTIKVRLQVDNNLEKDAAYIELYINGSFSKAKNDGTIYYTSKKAEDEITLQIADERDYVLTGNSTIPLPLNADKAITVFVRKPNTKEQAFAELKKSISKLDLKNNQLDSIRKSNIQLYNQLSKQLSDLRDSILKSITQSYKISETDLRSASEILEGRDKYFNLVTLALEGYLDEAKDVKDCFKTMLAFSLENMHTFIAFDSTRKVYNHFYNLLNNNHNEYERAISNYWKNEELAIGFNNVFDYAINDIHRTIIIPQNDSLILKLNMYLGEKDKKKKIELKSQLSNTLNAIIPQLTNNLAILDNKIKGYVIKLASQKNILPQ